jgi:hypothetical protein
MDRGVRDVPDQSKPDEDAERVELGNKVYAFAGKRCDRIYA